MSTQIAYGADAIPETRNETRNEARSEGSGWFQRIFDRLAASREAQANRYIVNYLATMSDERLADLGYTDVQIRSIRTERRLPEAS